MSKLLMSYKEIRESIKLKENEWNNIRTTNCYAYALGLDIPSGKLMSFGFEYPYDVGVIGSDFYQYDYFDLFGFSLEERLFLDLNALGIEFEESNQFDKIPNNNQNLSWLIAMYKDANSPDFHFLRKINNYYWMHKVGMYGNISNRDSKGNLITDLDTSTFVYSEKNRIIDYRFEKVYKLSLYR